ncbi:MAG: hypothetical protein JWQ38_2376 [Flavipsychrobacter sp.]|nr:hypothetical protein [Flavipsychrobacter sp.]
MANATGGEKARLDAVARFEKLDFSMNQNLQGTPELASFTYDIPIDEKICYFDRLT